MIEQNLQHIAFIMDGNRRWAKNKNLPIAMGHRQGAETLIKIAKAAKEMGIKYMTVYAFSTENWQRDKKEVDGLMDLLRHYLQNSFKELQDNNAKIIFIGERYMLAPDIIEKMREIENDTAQNDDVTLCVALSYGGRQEIVHAAKSLALKVAQGKLNADDIDAQKLAAELYTADLPDPDLLVRTSGEQRVSNFLPWQLAYTEMYFSPTLWPDFTSEELKKIIQDYNQRERRYGKS